MQERGLDRDLLFFLQDDMSIAILNIIVCLTLALVCGYFAFTVLGMFGSAMVELKKDNIDIKDDIFAELYMKMSPDTFSDSHSLGGSVFRNWIFGGWYNRRRNVWGFRLCYSVDAVEALQG